MSLDEIEKLCEALTTGEWAFKPMSRMVVNETGKLIAEVEKPEDGVFLANAKTLIPKLLEVAKVAKTVIKADKYEIWKELEEALEELEK